MTMKRIQQIYNTNRIPNAIQILYRIHMMILTIDESTAEHSHQNEIKRAVNTL